ncbi:hypothetical protein CDAR_449071 [Caerostris darwini]|uniref:Uncharacterized protein n=1 Tax=Caerostris darwini TaxID=1538125 RepID=A0AAV4QUE3_9ARAC|nr:hypothetical protein CDAR_449071 [Caerostris darwini]
MRPMVVGSPMRVTSSSARGRFYLELNPKASVKTRLCGVGSAQCYKLFIEKGRRAGHQSANSRQLRPGSQWGAGFGLAFDPATTNGKSPSSAEFENCSPDQD